MYPLTRWFQSSPFWLVGYVLVLTERETIENKKVELTLQNFICNFKLILRRPVTPCQKNQFLFRLLSKTINNSTTSYYFDRFSQRIEVYRLWRLLGLSVLGRRSESGDELRSHRQFMPAARRRPRPLCYSAKVKPLKSTRQEGANRGGRRQHRGVNFDSKLPWN